VSIVGRKANIFFKELVPSVEEGEEVISPVVDDEEEEKASIISPEVKRVIKYTSYVIALAIILGLIIVYFSGRKISREMKIREYKRKVLKK